MKCLFLFCILIFIITPIFSDTVIMKSGKTYENVRAGVKKTSIEFELDGKLITFSKSLVKGIKLKPVISKPPTNAKEQEEYDKERIRIADALQDSPEFSGSETGKPRLAILNFQPGSGVSYGEAETISNLVTQRLVKTKLFIIVDKLTLDKITKDCRIGEDCSKMVAEKVGANKILTGIITKIQNKYYINGTIIDKKNSKIDFAEKSIANSVDEIEIASDLFAKKVAGGILDFWDEPLFTPDKVNSIPFLWRSAVLPGFGQFHYGNQTENKVEKGKGIILGLITFSLIVNVANSYSRYDALKDNYDNGHILFLLSANRSNIELLSYVKDTENFNNLKEGSNNIKFALGAFTGFYILNLVDAFFLGKTFFKKAESRQSTFQIYPSRTTVSRNTDFLLDEQIHFEYKMLF